MLGRVMHTHFRLYVSIVASFYTARTVPECPSLMHTFSGSRRALLVCLTVCALICLYAPRANGNVEMRFFSLSLTLFPFASTNE